MSDDYDRAACPVPEPVEGELVEGAELAAIRARWQDQKWNVEDDRYGVILATSKWSVAIDVDDLDREVVALAAHAPADIRALLARLDTAEMERDTLARSAKAAVTALNAAVQRIAEERDGAYARLSSVCMYLERMALHTPEHERQITAIHAQIGPRSARIDELP